MNKKVLLGKLSIWKDRIIPWMKDAF